MSQSVRRSQFRSPWQWQYWLPSRSRWPSQSQCCVAVAVVGCGRSVWSQWRLQLQSRLRGGCGRSRSCRWSGCRSCGRRLSCSGGRGLVAVAVAVAVSVAVAVAVAVFAGCSCSRPSPCSWRWPWQLRSLVAVAVAVAFVVAVGVAVLVVAVAVRVAVAVAVACGCGSGARRSSRGCGRRCRYDQGLVIFERAIVLRVGDVEIAGDVHRDPGRIAQVVRGAAQPVEIADIGTEAVALPENRIGSHAAGKRERCIRARGCCLGRRRRDRRLESAETANGAHKLLALTPPLSQLPETKSGCPSTRSAVVSVVSGLLYSSTRLFIVVGDVQVAARVQRHPDWLAQAARDSSRHCCNCPK